MKKILTLIIAVLATVSLTSCVGVASTTSNNITQTQVVLSSSNFRVVGQAFGQSQATYVFFMGGIRKKALMANAIDEMSKNANLHGSQTLTNVTTNTSFKMITPIFIQVTCTATANVIEFQ